MINIVKKGSKQMTIYLNGNLVKHTQFPDGTSKIDLAHMEIGMVDVHEITWLFSPNEEMILYNVVNHIRNIDQNAKIVMRMPYLPNARMDRVKFQCEVFTLKWFAKFINSLNIDKVVVTDVHSNVGEALIDRMEEDYYPHISFYENVIKDFKPDVLFFPDAGAHKRYKDFWKLSDFPNTYGEKVRNWESGEISSLEVHDPEVIKGKRVLIVDDICSFGGTFYRATNQLEKNGASSIALAVTHAEDNILKGKLLELDSLEKVYTTDSIYKGEHPKVDVKFKFEPNKGIL